MNSMPETVVKSSRARILLGNLLVDDGLILPQDLDFALEHQKYTGQLLGEILVRIGALAPDDLERILQFQRKHLGSFKRY
jgi:type IV pilus assembly protein PilB